MPVLPDFWYLFFKCVTSSHMFITASAGDYFSFKHGITCMPFSSFIFTKSFSPSMPDCFTQYAKWWFCTERKSKQLCGFFFFLSFFFLGGGGSAPTLCLLILVCPEMSLYWWQDVRNQDLTNFLTQALLSCCFSKIFPIVWNGINSWILLIIALVALMQFQDRSSFGNI